MPHTPTKRNILVTGGCGFIGRHLVARLLKQGHRVSVLDDLSTSLLSDMVAPAHIHIGSVLDPGAVAKAAKGCDMVYHLASAVGHLRVKGYPKYAYDVSVTGMYNLVDQTDPHVPIVFLSSSAVYGRSQDVNEDGSKMQDALDYDDGTPGYASGKYRAELILQTRNRPWLIVRPFNVVGPGQMGDYGMVLPRLVRAAIEGKPLRVYGDGTQVRSFAHVETFLDVLLSLVNKYEALDGWTSYPDPVVNIGSPVATTINELAETVLALVKNEYSFIEYVPYETVYPGHRDVQCRVPDLGRLRRMLAGPPIEWPSVAQIVQDVWRSEDVRL